jgi:hypothetical protein
MDTDGGGEKVSAQPGSLPPMSAAAGGGAFATINVSPFLWYVFLRLILILLVLVALVLRVTFHLHRIVGVPFLLLFPSS